MIAIIFSVIASILMLIFEFVYLMWCAGVFTERRSADEYGEWFEQYVHLRHIIIFFLNPILTGFLIFNLFIR